MNEQVSMNRVEVDGKSDNKKRVFLNETLAYWYSIYKTDIWNVTETANFNTSKKCIKFSEWNLRMQKHKLDQRLKTKFILSRNNDYSTIPFPPEDGARVPPKRWFLIINIPAFTFSRP